MDQVIRKYQDASRAWQQTLDALLDRIVVHFGRKEMQERARDYLQGLLRPVERKNGWQLAEATGHAVPYSIQHLLDRARWDADAVRDEVDDYALEYLADSDAVLAADETGFLKKGTHSVGVSRQYSGTAGRVENCQIGVFLAYVSNKGRFLIDRRLYLPKQWADNQEDRLAAKVPDAVCFATKPELARQMIERAVRAGIPFRWFTADEVYGNNRRLRLWLEQQQIWHVMALACNQHVWLPTMRQATVQQLAATIAPDDWVRLAADNGAKGPRLYDWARLPLLSWQIPGERWLLLRRSVAKPEEIAYYVAYVPRGCPLQDMVRVAGSRWAIEECFEAAKGEVGLDQYEVRSWHGWYRHITLAMTAHAYLTVLYAIADQRPMFKKKDFLQCDAGLEEAKIVLAPLSVPELRKLLWQMLWHVRPCLAFIIHWSHWRRHHQAIAMMCHWQRRIRAP